MQSKVQKLKTIRSTAQRGFTMIELLVVIAIMSVLIAIAFPGLQGLYREARAPAHARDLIKAVTSIQSTANTVATATPYSGITTANLANALTDTAFSVSAGTITHSIQAAGLNPQSVSISGTPGANLQVLVSKVHPKACVPMVTQVVRAAESVKVGAVVVKAAGGLPSVNAIQASCDVVAGVDIEYTFQ